MEKCLHHWILDPPTGKTSMGVCKHCKQVKSHNNMPNDRAFYREVRPGSGKKVLVRDIFFGKL